MARKVMDMNSELFNSLVRKVILYEREQQPKPQEKKQKAKKEKVSVEPKKTDDAYEQAIDTSKYDKILADLIAD